MESDLRSARCDLIHVKGRYVFMAIGVPGLGLSEMAETKDFVLYVFETPSKAQEAGTVIARMSSPTLDMVDEVVQHCYWCRLGTGAVPPAKGMPWKVTVHSETGFVHDALRNMDTCIGQVEAGDWSSTPRARSSRPEDDEIDGCALGQKNAPPAYQVNQPEQWRYLPGKIGKDEKGRRCVKDWTYVKAGIRFPTKDANPFPERRAG